MVTSEGVVAWLRSRHRLFACGVRDQWHAERIVVAGAGPSLPLAFSVGTFPLCFSNGVPAQMNRA